MPLHSLLKMAGFSPSAGAQLEHIFLPTKQLKVPVTALNQEWPSCDTNATRGRGSLCVARDRSGKGQRTQQQIG